MRSEHLHRFSLEALLAWGFGLPILSGLLTAALAFTAWYFINTAFDEYERQDMPIALFAATSQDDWLKVRRYEENFLLSPGAATKIVDAKMRYVALWKTHLNDIRTNLQKIRVTAGENDRPLVDSLSGIDALLTNYETNFNAVVDLVVRLGDNDEGLEGEMAAKSSAAEAALMKTKLPALIEHFLTLRRLQADFVLTGKEQDVAGFSEEAAQIDKLGTTALNIVQRQALLDLLKDYVNVFNRYVVGVRDLESKKRNYTEAAQRLDTSVDQLQHAALQNANDGLKHAEHRVGNTTYIAVAIALASVLLGIIIIVIAIFVAGRIRTATRRIIGFAAHLAAGKLETRLNQVDSGEFGALEAALNAMADRLQTSDDTMSRQAHNLLEYNNRIGLLSEMTGLLQTVVSMKEATEVVARHMAALGIGIGGGVYLYKESRNYLDVLARWGEVLLIDSFSPDDCWALRRGQSYGTAGHASEMSAVLICSHTTYGDNAYPYLCLPMVAQSETLGLVHIVFDHGETTVSEEKRQFARRITEQLSLALANLKLRETLREQSLSDPLTNLFNRRYLQISLDREFARASREKRPIAVLMLDVDHFKRFNDTHGHEAGDAALRLLGRLLKENCRGGDLACRFGGEEFTVVLPDANTEDGLAWARRLMDKVRKMEINLHGTMLPYLTVSIGLALYPEHGEDAQTVLQAADFALYKAKHSGRDRCVVKTLDDNATDHGNDVEKSLKRSSTRDMSADQEC